MNPRISAIRLGIARGGIELRQALINSEDLFSLLFLPMGTVVAMFFMRGHTFGGTGIGLGTLALPSILGMLVGFNATMLMAQVLVLDREDGTMLRAKATPNGILGYLVGKVVTVSGSVLVPFVVVLIAGLIMIGGTDLRGPGSWLLLIGTVLLGLLATLPIGAVVGSVLSSPRSLGLLGLPIMALGAVSGIFYPITALPTWLQVIGQIFPIYWMGLGTRAAMLPDAAAAVEIGASWRHWETGAVLGVWAVLGLSLAPILLRRMARRESGGRLAARRDRAMQRAY
ncbi:ABC transporter permease [Nocardia panacis]|uniref:ABC transporter permease n=1 Tax=Nocardia panacis TaxID=2340916 RepID=A0A3A4KTQ6_9NOCA|nr:ABC transporter permease [Nocardia panacis]RJO76836.1 ABC transporter permease [Nocardia panacis]